MTDTKLTNYIDFVEFASINEKSKQEFLVLMYDVADTYAHANQQKKDGAKIVLALMAFNALTIVSGKGNDLFPAPEAEKTAGVQSLIEAYMATKPDGFSNSFEDTKRMNSISDALQTRNLTLAKKLPEIV